MTFYKGFRAGRIYYDVLGYNCLLINGHYSRINCYKPTRFILFNLSDYHKSPALLGME